MAKKLTRRKFLKDCSALTAGSLAAGSTSFVSCTKSPVKVKEGGVISIEPTPRFEISSYFYLQFMEPLGITDGSVEAGWDYNIDNWRVDLVDIVKDGSNPRITSRTSRFFSSINFESFASRFNRIRGSVLDALKFNHQESYSTVRPSR